MIYNIFIDESCHLEKDGSSIMCIGFIKVPEPNYDDFKTGLLALKAQFKQHAEIKWNQFSRSRIPLYKSFVNYFFTHNLEFKCILVKYKERLGEVDLSRGSHENFYYKMIEFLLKLNQEDSEYKVFLDIINTRGKERLNKIQESLSVTYNDKSPIIDLQHLHSHHNIFFELTDLFVGSVAYSARKLLNEVPVNEAKNEFLSYLEEKSGYSISEGTELWETKFNIIDHQPKQRII
ncbi:DUF3800 domain-containing protein [Mucilaginibacter sp. X5P1]|uniref:DUF3800 domain-containing protein n=1 Tax=Mucilaginibacter sp. X5P1 TaxID=2723088 RepID=UPI001614FCD4|nr:DUF3800 domain-containing protein [Mucilaginibacter sp. X5P1]MBB6137633.1 hypothetical protein [Mucilaginibacter sp. X5P1]